MRGKPPSPRAAGRTARITPAGAGKTLSKQQKRPLQRDHPRRCGENGCSVREQLHVSGSPPQVRGKLAAGRNGFLHKRITPAGAGKTAEKSARAEAERDHPRRCGENVCGGIQGRIAVGSPPQVRGKLR
mgnify:CR=1 FL=1